MSLLTDIWIKQPDTRFNQLIDNLQWEYSNDNDGAGKKKVYRKEKISAYVTAYEKNYTIDLFYLEDDKFIAFLENKLKEENNNG